MRHTNGMLEVICGSMFCGKTEELIRRLRRAKIAQQKFQLFKPIIDQRYSVKKVASHAGREMESRPLQSAAEILTNLDPDTTVVGIDEVQFFDDEILCVIDKLIEKKIRVIVTGLDTDFRGEPFGCVPTLMAKAERVDKLHAICVVCGEDASRTQRFVNGKPARYDEPVVVVGAAEMYEARCRKHHEVPGKPKC